MDETRMMTTIQTWTAILFAVACYLISPVLSLIVVFLAVLADSTAGYQSVPDWRFFACTTGAVVHAAVYG
ncbi:hypothetical protein [Secundilactobacillus collinoides]|uniref:hypothetical protein n=1 Tax=Secundilactobacillus collinoides TaxID=33960 RepID=UPI0006CF29F5|nr:hypothetical protein [Secundilactobacillus collinoides]